VSHAQILVGDAEQTRARALVLAKGVNCLNTADSQQPCDTCISCKVFESGNHPDTFYVARTKQVGIGVDDIRDQIIAPMSTKPFSYNYKVFIIDKADTLTPAAQSALLKTIEEPAPYGVFLFIAPHEHNFLPTVLSRCHLTKIAGGTSTCENPQLHEIAQEVVDNAHNWDILAAFAYYKKFEQYKESKENLIKLLDLIYNAFGEKIAASHSPNESLINAVSAITHAKSILARNGNTQLAIEMMLVEFCNHKEAT